MSKTVAEKLGFKPGMRVRVEGAPADVVLDLPAGAEEPHDLLLFFVRDAAAIAAAAPVADRLYREGARLWFAYPKKSGALRTDISRDHGWEPVGALGLMGVTQIAIDDTWSALRFRRRAEIATLTRKFGATPGAKA
jgi:hypothetical protein